MKSTLASALDSIGRIAAVIVVILLIWTPIEIIARWAWRLSRIAVGRFGP